jgi:hypothetical protein
MNQVACKAARPKTGSEVARYYEAKTPTSHLTAAKDTA